MSRTLHLYLPVDAFTLCGDDFRRDDGSHYPPEARLLGILEVSGVRHHLELIAVEIRDEEQHTVIRELDSFLDAAFMIGAASPLATISYNGIDYVLLVTPFEA